MKTSDAKKIIAIMLEFDLDEGTCALGELLDEWPEFLPLVEDQWARPWDDGDGSYLRCYGKPWAEWFKWSKDE